jgi:hypothetical protein
MATPTYCRKKASEIGPHTEDFIQKILEDHAMKNLRKVQALLRLAEKHGSVPMEAASQRALFFGNFNYRSFKTILEKGWLVPKPKTDAAPIALSSMGQRFLRAPDYFAQKKEVAA